MPRPSTTLVLYRLWIAAVFVVFGMACLHEAFGPFLFGHDGYNGSAFAQAARNSIRFGVLEQAQYYTGTAPPPLAEIYTNHPILLHIHLIAAFAVLGVEDWVGRLVPVLYSLAFLVLLYRVVARRFSPLTAAFAITLWTLTPLHTIFANMIDHEQGGLFWCLLLIDRYLRWLDTRRREWVIHLAVTMAMQFDWPGYYFAFFIGVHALVDALSARSTDGSAWAARPLWRRLGFLTRFSVVVLVNVVAFFGWIASLRGGLDAMWSAFALRSGSSSGYGQLILDRSLDLYGAGLLILLGLWLLWSIVRLVRGRATMADFIPWCFFLGQLIHSLVFKSAGAIHSYWTFYVGPALAIGGASLIVALRDRIFAFATARGVSADKSSTEMADAPEEGERVEAPEVPAVAAHGDHKGVRLPVQVAFYVVVALGLFFQARFAGAQHFWGYADHRASYVAGARDEWIDTQWAQALHARFGRDDTCYLVHPSAERRVHFSFYIDAPRHDGIELRPDGGVSRHRCQGARPIALIDTGNIHGHELDLVWDLVLTHQSHVWDGRFVAIELAETRPQGATIEAWRWETTPPSFFWSWLVSTPNAPGTWVADERRDWLPEGGLEGAKNRKRWAGGKGGVVQRVECPPGAVVVSLRVTEHKDVVESAAVDCSPVAGIKPRDGAVPPSTSGAVKAGVIGLAASTNPELGSNCASNAIATGFHGRAGLLVDAIGVVCSPLRRNSGGKATLGGPRNGPAQGGRGGSNFRFLCPSGGVLTGLDARGGALVDAVSPICTPLSDLLPVEPADPGAPEPPGSPEEPGDDGSAPPPEPSEPPVPAEPAEPAEPAVPSQPAAPAPALDDPTGAPPRPDAQP